MADSKLRGTRVLVTGARGFIGSHVCRRLIADGAVVHGTSSAVDVPPRPTMSWTRVDLSDPVAVRDLFKVVRPDVVFHLAARVTGSQALSEVGPTLNANLVSTVHVLTAAADGSPCRVVLAGSMREPEFGDPAAIPCSPYAVAKWASSAYARMFHALYDLRVIVARLMMVYRPGQWDLTKLVPYVTTTLLAGRPPQVSGGTAEADWVYVEDVVDGLLAAAASTADGQEVDIGTGTLTSVRTVVERIASLLGTGGAVRFGAVPERPLEEPRAADIEGTRRVIGWTSRTTLTEGLARTVEWYRTVRLPVRDSIPY